MFCIKVALITLLEMEDYLTAQCIMLNLCGYLKQLFGSVFAPEKKNKTKQNKTKTKYDLVKTGLICLQSVSILKNKFDIISCSVCLKFWPACLCNLSEKLFFFLLLLFVPQVKNQDSFGICK